MKTILIVVALCLVAWTTDVGTNFCDGWEDGYKAGWCYQQGPGCYEPYVPYCPYPNYKESSDSYEDGYNRGFVTALESR